MRKLNTTNLELAVWIAKLGSFTAAAERMNTTQPAVSARVKELEDSLGSKVFVRQGRGVELTPEGREFVSKAEEILKQIDALSVSFTKASSAGVVRLGSSSFCLDLLAAICNTTLKTMPLVTYQVEIERAGPLIERLDARKLDVVIVTGPLELHKMRKMCVGYDRMIWVASAALMRDRSHLPESERLKGLPIWCVHPDSFYWASATVGLEAQGVNLQRLHTIGNTLGVARLVSAGAGIGLTSESVVAADLDRKALVRLPNLGQSESIEISIVCSSDISSSIIDDVMTAAVACSPFRKTPF